MHNLLRQPTLLIAVILVTLTGAACAKPGGQDSTPGGSTAFADGTATPLAVSENTSPSVPTSATPRPSATPDMTETAIQAFAATADAVGTQVAARGGDVQGVFATLGALGLYASPTPYALPTPTPLPFPVSTEQYEANGATRTRFGFENPEDLRAARQVYEQYFDFISFRAGPPPQDLQTALEQYMVQSTHLQDPGSCYLLDVQVKVSGLASKGQYVRITPTPLQWDDGQIFLDVGPTGITVAMDWEERGALLELVDIRSGAVLKQKGNVTLSGTARLIYDSGSNQWLLEDDDHGFYCNSLQFFLD